jgi:hypothetical protein
VTAARGKDCRFPKIVANKYELTRTIRTPNTPDNVGVDSMKKISIAFLAAMSLAAFGCNKNNKNKGSESIAKMTELKDKMCACKDKACSDTVSDELSKWTQEQAKAADDKPIPPSKEDAKKTAAVTDEMIKCMLKLEIPGGADAAGAAGGTMGDGSPAAGSADGSAAANGSAGGAAADGAGGSAH